MKLLRWLHKLYANFFGYFWLPCPICGEYFGGHESCGIAVQGEYLEFIGILLLPGGYLEYHATSNSKVVCPRCGDKAREINHQKCSDWLIKNMPDIYREIIDRTYIIPPNHPMCKCSIPSPQIPPEEFEKGKPVEPERSE